MSDVNVRRPVLSSLGVRLSLAFVAVAFAAIGVFGVLTMLSARHEVSTLSNRNRQDDLAATAFATADAYQRANGWEGADLNGAAAIAARSQATLTVIDAKGTVVAAPTDVLATMMEQMHGVAAVDTPRGDPVSRPVVVDGTIVGAVMLRFPTETMDAERHVRDALARTAITGTLVAAAVALIVAIYVSIRVTRPVTALTTAAGDLAAGRRHARVEVEGPGELRTLAQAFNDMADNLDREDELRRNLVADVAHELRTPLTILQGSTEALLDGVDQPTPEVLGSLNDEVTRLRRLVADLEILAAAEAAGLQVHADHLDLADVVAEAVDLLRPLADDGDLTLSTDTSPAPVIADADRLHQIVVNLIANAVKFTPSGGSVTIRTRTDQMSAVLEVVDTGPGIPPEDLPHVFERFWRGANRNKAAGSGIGLAVVAELTAAHLGTVTVENAHGGGARFIVTLPLDHIG